MSRNYQNVNYYSHSLSNKEGTSSKQSSSYINENENNYLNKEEKTNYYKNEKTELQEGEIGSHYLKEKEILIGSDGKSEYILEPWLSEEIAKKIENDHGIFLKKGEGENEKKFNSLLGEGAYGKFYIGFKREGIEERIIGIKVIIENLEGSEFEAIIQSDLTIGIEQLGQESRLIPIFDIIKEKDEKNGKLIRLNIVMPLASFGNVNSLREKLKSENDKQLKRLVSKLICKDLLIGIWQMHNQGYYHLDIKLENMVITSQGK